MSTPQDYEQLRSAILEGDISRATEAGEAFVKDLPGLAQAVDTAIETIRTVGDLFGLGEIYLPELMLAADAMLAFMGVVGPHLAEVGRASKATSKVVLGTVKGDIHSIGKDLVGTMLRASGFEVIDLGVNVAPMDMIKTADQTGAKVIALSALMTTSMPYQREVVELITALEKRKNYWVIVGGGPVTAEYAKKISANGWATSAAGAAALCERLLGSGQSPDTAEFVMEAK